MNLSLRSLGRGGPLTAAALFLFALGVRWLYIWEVWGSESVRYLMVDSRAYHERAIAILGGDWLGDRVFYQDALYPYFLAGLYALFGPGSVGVLGAQALLDATTVLAISLIARRLCGDRCGLVAGVLAALYKPFIYYDALLLKTSLSLFLISWALYLLQRAEESRRRRGWFFAGLGLGLASLTRGNYLVFVPVVLAWIWLPVRRVPLRKVGCSAAVALGLFSVLLPVMIRNRYVGDDWVLTTSQAGQNFFIGNNRQNITGIYESPAFVRPNPRFEEADFAREARRRSGREMKPSELSRFWFREAARDIAAEPGHFLAHTWKKVRLFVNDYEVPDNYSYDFFEQNVSLLLALPLPDYGLLLPLAVCGAWFTRRSRPAWLLLAYFAAYGASVILFYNMSRYRIPVVPVVIVFAAVALTRLAAALKARQVRTVAAAAALLVPAYAVAHQRVVERDFSKHYVNLGLAHLERAREHERRADELSTRGDPTAEGEEALAEELRGRAKAEFRRGLDLRPQHPLFRRALREALLEQIRRAAGSGEHERAVALARELTASFPRLADAYWHLGSNLARLGRREEARLAFQRALALAPGHAGARSELLWLQTSQPARPEGGAP